MQFSETPPIVRVADGLEDFIYSSRVGGFVKNLPEFVKIARNVTETAKNGGIFER